MSSLSFNDGDRAEPERATSDRAETRAGDSVDESGTDASANSTQSPNDSEGQVLDAHATPSDERTDEQLLAAYRGGEKPAFSTLVSRYQRELFHFLIRFLGDRATAEDVFQESFLQVHQSMNQFDPTRRFRPWLFTIAANKARDLMRSRSRRPTSPLQASISGDSDGGEFIDLLQAAQSFPDEPIQLREMQEAVQRTVVSMPEHLREILLLSYFHQFPYKQISDILNIPLGTVKSRLHAAVAYFADRWKSMNQNKSWS